MGAFKDIQTEAEEKASDPVFRLAVVLIMEDLLRNIFDKTADIIKSEETQTKKKIF